MNVDHVDKLTYCIVFISAIRTVAAGHKLVADGWALFESVCSEAGPGELPQLLRSLKMTTTPTPATTPPPSTSQASVEIKEEDRSETPVDRPIKIKLDTPKKTYAYQYKCPQCDVTPTTTRRAMDAHIRAQHTKVPFVCSYCMFSTYNLDSMQRHEKKHN